MATLIFGARSNSLAKGNDMYLWHKNVSPRWLIPREAVLQDKTNYGLAVIQKPNRKRLRLEVSFSSRRVAESFRAQFGGRIEPLPRNWRRHLTETVQTKPLRIGNRLIVQSRSKDHRAEARALPQLIIPVAGAFGTGAHATTAMCLREMEKISRSWSMGWTMLDAGTGTGILALAARSFGAGNVIALDNDPCAIAAAKNNARLNRIDGILFKTVDVAKWKTQRKFDIIIANLFSELLIKVIPKWKWQLKAAGILILSGILREQEQEMIRVLRKNKFRTEEIRRRGKWVALCARVARASGLRMI